MNIAMITSISGKEVFHTSTGPFHWGPAPKPPLFRFAEDSGIGLHSSPRQNLLLSFLGKGVIYQLARAISRPVVLLGDAPCDADKLIKCQNNVKFSI
jgi:hypothetical protein